MGKRAKQITATSGHNLQKIEHTEFSDDNLLPAASEIEKLQQIDPNIVEWLKARAEKEQEFRHTAFNSRVKLTDDVNKREHNTTRWALFAYVFIMTLFIGLSFFLIINGNNLTGSIFGTAAVVLAIAVLIHRKPTNNK